jgi:two-component system, OmpR family, phosphate regulon sensor histidine kinase PhoR
MQHRVVRDLSEHVQPLELANAELRGVLADAQRSLRGYLLTGDGQLLDTYDDARTSFPAAGDLLLRLAHDDERPAVHDQIDRANSWWMLAEQQRQVVPRSDAAAAFTTRGKALFQDFAAENTRFDTGLADRVAYLQQRSDRLSTISIAGVVSLTLIAAVTAMIAAVVISRRITRPLARVVKVIDRRRGGELEARADVTGPAEIRAVAAAVNEMAEEHERIRREEDDIARLRAEVRALGYRIRAHLHAADALREAVRGLATTLNADHVLVRMAPGQTDVPPLVSLRDEHLTELAGLAARDISWLDSGEVPPDAERDLYAGRPALTVPVSSGEERMGALTLLRDAGRPPWSPVELRLAESVAADLGRGVHHARLYEREKHLVARLQVLDDAKTDFMSTVSHELRTPLTSIAGYVELLLDDEDGEIGPGQQRMLEVVARNTRRLRELIEDMLTLSKIESGAFRTARRPVDVAALCEQALAAIGPAANKADVTLTGEVDTPLELTADPDQVDRILSNLLSNAVKFTPAGGTVTLRARRDGDHALLEVADTGLGIPAAEQDQLFARFFRASNAIKLAIPGTGLGLAIVRTIVDNHHGRIAVDSPDGGGTTVSVRLPVR